MKRPLSEPGHESEASSEMAEAELQPAVHRCQQCRVTHTPQWREGPAGPKSLCNACGVKWQRQLKKLRESATPTKVHATRHGQRRSAHNTSGLMSRAEREAHSLAMAGAESSEDGQWDSLRQQGLAMDLMADDAPGQYNNESQEVGEEGCQEADADAEGGGRRVLRGTNTNPGEEDEFQDAAMLLSFAAGVQAASAEEVGEEDEEAGVGGSRLRRSRRPRVAPKWREDEVEVDDEAVMGALWGLEEPEQQHHHAAQEEEEDDDEEETASYHHHEQPPRARSAVVSRQHQQPLQGLLLPAAAAVAGPTQLLVPQRVSRGPTKLRNMQMQLAAAAAAAVPTQAAAPVPAATALQPPQSVSSGQASGYTYRPSALHVAHALQAGAAVPAAAGGAAGASQGQLQEADSVEAARCAAKALQQHAAQLQQGLPADAPLQQQGVPYPELQQLRCLREAVMQAVGKLEQADSDEQRMQAALAQSQAEAARAHAQALLHAQALHAALQALDQRYGLRAQVAALELLEQQQAQQQGQGAGAAAAGVSVKQEGGGSGGGAAVPAAPAGPAAAGTMFHVPIHRVARRPLHQPPTLPCALL